MKRLLLMLLLVATPALAEHTIGEHAIGVSPVGIESSVKNDQAYDAQTYAPKLQDRFAQAATSTTTQTRTPTEPASVTTTVKGGTLAADILQWVQLGLLPAIGAALIGLIVKGMGYIGIATTAQQSDQLKKIVIDGLNSAFTYFEGHLRASNRLDIDVKGQVIADAIAYTQEHAKETLTAMGLDPKSGKAVEKIRAKIETVLNDPATPTPDAITPDSGKIPVVNGVIIQGSKA